jgi:cell wall-associated NlpC family hydrolase
MSVADNYLGIPYKEDGESKAGCYCWGFVRLFYKEVLNIILPDKDTCRDPAHWERSFFAQQYDIVAIKSGKGIVNHAGIYLGNGIFIHCIKAGVVKNKVRDNVWKGRIAGYFRYKYEH